MKEAEGSRTEYEKEIEELKELLPEIREKIEDAKESQHSGNVAELALKATLVGLVSFSSFDNNMFDIVEGIVVLVFCWLGILGITWFPRSWKSEGT